MTPICRPATASTTCRTSGSAPVSRRLSGWPTRIGRPARPTASSASTSSPPTAVSPLAELGYTPSCTKSGTPSAVPDNLHSLRRPFRPGHPHPKGPPPVSASHLGPSIGPRNRLFDGNQAATTAAFFSVDGGAKKVADWATDSPADFLGPPPPSNGKLTPGDPFNNENFRGDELAKLTTADVQLMEALGFRVGPTAVIIFRLPSHAFYATSTLSLN